MWLILRILHNVTESYRYYYKTVTNLEKGVMRTYNGSMSRLYNEIQQKLNEVDDIYNLEKIVYRN